MSCSTLDVIINFICLSCCILLVYSFLYSNVICQETSYVIVMKIIKTGKWLIVEKTSYMNKQPLIFALWYFQFFNLTSSKTKTKSTTFQCLILSSHKCLFALEKMFIRWKEFNILFVAFLWYVLVASNTIYGVYQDIYLRNYHHTHKLMMNGSVCCINYIINNKVWNDSFWTIICVNNYWFGFLVFGLL